MVSMILSSSGRLRSDRLHVELDVYLAAHEHSASFQDLIPFEPEVFSVDGRLGGEARLLVAPRVLAFALEFRVEHDFLRDTVDREISGYGIVTPFLRDALALEGQGWKLLHIEKVGRLE